jgi:hypothetical protein
MRGPYGRWEHHAHPELSRWLAIDLESSLRRLGDGDWIGNEEPAVFTPCERAAAATDKEAVTMSSPVRESSSPRRSPTTVAGR